MRRNVPFRLNGKVYVKRFAYLPVKASNKDWLWLVDYYRYKNKHKELITLSTTDWLLVL